MLGGLTGSPTLIFKMIGEDSKDTASSLEWMKDTIGIEFGDQFPIFKINHRIAWGPERKYFLLEQFNQYVEAFADLPFESIGEHGIQSERQRKILCEIALNYLRVKWSGRLDINDISQEEIDTLEAIVEHNPYFAAPKQMLGQISEITGHLERALQLFSDCIQISLNCGDAELHKAGCLMKAGVLEKVDRIEEALKEYMELSKAYPEDREIINKISSLQEYGVSSS